MAKKDAKKSSKSRLNKPIEALRSPLSDQGIRYILLDGSSRKRIPELNAFVKSVLLEEPFWINSRYLENPEIHLTLELRQESVILVDAFDIRDRLTLIKNLSMLLLQTFGKRFLIVGSHLARVY